MNNDRFLEECNLLLKGFANSPEKLKPEYIDALLWSITDSIASGFHVERDDFIDWLLQFNLIPETRKELEDAKY